MKRLKLPIGISSFERIRTGGFLYVDKTKNISDMVENGDTYFLSRPRRFGKSLLISTLRDLLEGKRHLFKDLWIDKNNAWNWEKLPVVVIDFNGISCGAPDDLKASLTFALEEYAAKNGFKLESPLLKTKFKELILKLRDKLEKKVAVLVDEYDKPMIDFIGKGNERLKTGIENREILKDFYGVLKDADVACALRFILITGVSKFGKISIFSELNNLYDLTMKEEACDLLGYTHNELQNCFVDEIKDLANKQNETENETVNKLKTRYNGYRFSDRDVNVYNPFSILQALRSLSYKNFWFETGSPSFLINLIKENNYFPPDLENIKTEEEAFSSFDLEALNLEAILFQTGYLTIKETKNRMYTLGYPNQEVKASLTGHMFTAYSEIENSSDRSKFLKLPVYLEAKEYEKFFSVIKSIYATIPYTLSSKQDEAYFHSIFYLMITASGIDAKSEVLTSKGRIDMAMELASSIYIIEFKRNQSAEDGLNQIRQKKYYERYLSAEKEIYLLAISFSSAERNVVEWRVKPLDLNEETANPYRPVTSYL